MIKYSELFYKFLSQKGIEDFSLKEIEEFNNYLPSLKEVEERVIEDKSNSTVCEEILCSNISKEEKLEKLEELIERFPHDVNFQLSYFLLSRNTNRAALYFYNEVEEMYNGEYVNLIGFFYDFFGTKKIMELGSYIMCQYFLDKEYSLAEKIGTTLLLLNTNDTLETSSTLAYIYLIQEKYDDLVNLYMRFKNPKIEVVFALFIAYLKLGKIDFASTMCEIVHELNPFVIMGFFALIDFDYEKFELVETFEKGSFEEAKVIIYKLNIYFSIEERLHIITSLDQDEIIDLLSPYLDLEEEFMQILFVINELNETCKKTNDYQIIDKVARYFYNNIDVNECSKMIKENLNTLISKKYVEIKDDSIILSPLGKIVIEPHLETEEEVIYS